MQKEIEQMVAKCERCSERAKNHEMSDQPWLRVSSDLFEYQGVHYLICVDSYSNYPEVVRLGKNNKICNCY